MGEKNENKIYYCAYTDGTPSFKALNLFPLSMASAATVIDSKPYVEKELMDYFSQHIYTPPVDVLLVETLPNKLAVDKIIVNGDATIVFWADGKKTIVKKSEDDEYDLHHAFCAALAKRIYGHNSTVKKMIWRKTIFQSAKKK
jgi:hypothetical protein